MSDQGIKSRPIYVPVSLDASGRRHLLVTDQPAVPAEGIDGDHGVFPEVWTVSRDGRSPSTPFMRGEPKAVHVFRSLTLLMDALRIRLAREVMGMRLYAVGSETFLADVTAAGLEAGLSAAELHLSHAGSLSRRVYCVHCRTLTEGVTDSIVACSGCGASLFVRDHFSRRFGAFMGVQVDAEAPGDLPPNERLYP